MKGTTKLYCYICRAEYFRTKSASINSKFCSRECRAKSDKTLVGYKSPRWKGGKLITKCFLCNKHTQKIVAHAKKSTHIFCSSRCRMIFYRGKQKNKQTDIEIIVENILLQNNISYTPQKTINSICIADFYLNEYNIAIFCDGDYWHCFPKGKPRDAWQIEQLYLIGIKGIRLWGSEIKKPRFSKKLLKVIHRKN